MTTDTLDELDALVALLVPPVNRDENSRAAAAFVRKHAQAGNNRRVLRAIVAAGIEGRTNDEMEQELHALHQSVSPSVFVLHRAGLIERVGKRPTRSRQKAWVYVLARQWRLRMEGHADEPRRARPIFGKPETGYD